MGDQFSSRTSLLDIPLELRRNIYKFVLDGTEPQISVRHIYDQVSYSTDGGYTSKPTLCAQTKGGDLLLVCRQMYTEAHPIFYNCAFLVIDRQTFFVRPYTKALWRALTTMKGIHVRGTGSIRKICRNANLMHLEVEGDSCSHAFTGDLNQICRNLNHAWVIAERNSSSIADTESRAAWHSEQWRRADVRHQSMREHLWEVFEESGIQVKISNRYRSTQWLHSRDIHGRVIITCPNYVSMSASGTRKRALMCDRYSEATTSREEKSREKPPYMRMETLVNCCVLRMGQKNSYEHSGSLLNLRFESSKPVSPIVCGSMTKTMQEV